MSENSKENYLTIKHQLPDTVTLVAVSKNHSAEKIQQVYDVGCRIFGENKVQELLEKQTLLPKDIKWHMIGHLQTNKVKFIAEFIDTIQSVDSEKLLLEINRQAEKHQRKINILLQVKIASEESKFGLKPHDARQLLQRYTDGAFPNVKITGLMGMATFTEDKCQVRREFLTLKKISDELNHISPLQTLSMGMSDDYQLAVECGANAVRVGSKIFGDRE